MSDWQQRFAHDSSRLYVNVGQSLGAASTGKRSSVRSHSPGPLTYTARL